MSKALTLLIALSLLSACDAGINIGINLGSQIIVDGIGAAFRSNTQPDYPRSQGTSHLVCNPVGETVVDPTTECHSAVTQ